MHRGFSGVMRAAVIVGMTAAAAWAAGKQPAEGKLLLRSAAVTTSAANDQLALAEQAGQFDAGTWYVLQLDGPITPQRRAALAQAGVTLGDYLPDYAYIVRLDRVQPAGVAATGVVQWVGHYQAEWKLDPAIGKPLVPYATPQRQAVAASGKVEVTITLFRDADAQAAERELVAAGATVVEHGDVAGHIALDAIVSPEQLAALAAVVEVQYIEDAAEITYRNSSNRWIVQSDVLNFTPLYDHGITGVGQVFGLLDGQVNQNHCSFRDTVNPIGPLHRKILAYNTAASYDQHGTHTAGTGIGDAGVNDNTRGVAYGAKIVYNLESLTASTAQSRWTQHHNQGGRVHSNSWGNDGTTSYDALCVAADDFSRQNEDSLVTFAVTNQADLRNPENAKNILAVGASQDTPNEGSFCSGGTGPTSDGRRKPEIYAPGCGTVSSSGNGSVCTTASLTGTSMASPAVAGTGLLVRQYYTDGYYPTGDATPTDGFIPTGALIKASLLNSAVDMTGIANYPSDKEGWGRVLADNSLYFPGDARKLWVEDIRNADGLSTGQNVDYFIKVNGAGQKLKVTLVWTEPAGTSGAANPVVNDLDLEVVDPSNAVYRGNVFNTATGESLTGGVKDAKNNVEQMHLSSPTIGIWTVRVKAATINQSTQGYALVVSGDIQPELPALRVSLPGGTPSTIAPGSGAGFNVQIQDGDETLQPGTALLYYTYGGGPFQAVALSPLGGDLYQADLPTTHCGDLPHFYVSATGSGGTVVTQPPTAPASFFTADVGNFTTVFTDNFETDQGWTTSFAGATSGFWQRGIPVNDPNWIYAPAADGDGSGKAWLTENDNNPAYPTPFNTDVDSGSVTLTSPMLNLASPQISFTYLYYLRLTDASTDRLLVEVNTNDGVGAWTQVALHNTDGARTWRSFTINQGTLSAAGITGTASTKIRFTANDANPASVVEAGLDGFAVQAFVCVPTETCSDGVQNQGESRIDCGGPCPACECESDAACDDGLYCTGVETCDAHGTCVAGTPPCTSGCDESLDACLSACADADVNCDGHVDGSDILTIRAPGTWNTASTDRADVNHDGNVDGSDILTIRAPGVWNTSSGPCTCP